MALDSRVHFSMHGTVLYIGENCNTQSLKYLLLGSVSTSRDPNACIYKDFRYQVLRPSDL